MFPDDKIRQGEGGENRLFFLTKKLEILIFKWVCLKKDGNTSYPWRWVLRYPGASLHKASNKFRKIHSSNSKNYKSKTRKEIQSGGNKWFYLSLKLVNTVPANSLGL